jgi:catechol 2,3-dioxygenase-like lactoylglutathione lyase family enzyme
VEIETPVLGSYRLKALCRMRDILRRNSGVATAEDSANTIGMAERTSDSTPQKASLTMQRKSILGSQELVAFVATRHPSRAKEFYRDTLGLPLVSEDEFALVFDAAGTMLRVTRVQELAAAKYTVLGWQVRDIVQTAKDLQRAHVTLERYPGMQQDKLGIWNSPSGARVAWFKDPDGNTLSITQF